MTPRVPRATDEAEGLSVWESARLRIARFVMGSADELDLGLRLAARVSSETLDVERVGVWLFEAEHTRIVSRCVYLRSAKAYEAPTTLELAQYPAYARSLEVRRVVAANDALTQPSTRELTDTYLLPNAIQSMMDAPIFRQGEVIGVVCHEQTETPRAWTQRERDFAGSVADMVGALFEQAARLEAEAAHAHDRLGRDLSLEPRPQRERFDALARLAAGMAHDFNNVLFAIRLLAESAKASSPERATALAEQILEETGRGAGLVTQLLGVCRAQQRSPVPILLGEAVRRTEPLLRTLLDGRCRLEMDLAAADGLWIRADATQLEQVLMNLVINARDAMAGPAASGSDGVVTLRVARGVGEDERQAVIEVKDTGVGISPVVAARIFEPFFSTKGEQGTGLGLATVHGIVEQNGGTITVESMPGRGATFRICWPLLVGPLFVGDVP